MSSKRSEAEAWLLAGEPVSGVLAWDRSRESRTETVPTSASARAWAVELVAKNLQSPQLSRVRAVESLLSRLELAESATASRPHVKAKRKHG